jgi:uncharacterized membrane protein
VAGERPARLDLSRPRTYGELVRETLHVFRRHADVLLTVALVLVAPVMLLVDGIWGRALAEGADATPSLAAQIVSAVVSVFVILPLISAANALVVRDLGEGTAPRDVGTTLRAGARAFPRVLGAVLAYAVAVVAGFVLLVVPGVWLAIRCYFAGQAAALDGLGPSAAMRRSSDLVHGQWWRTCGCLLATGLLLGLAGSIATNALAASGSGAVYVAGTAVVEAVVVTLTAIFATLLLYDLRARHERPADVLP